MDDHFEELFKRSVNKRLMSDVPVGVLFSGGVDSTLNTVAFQQENASRKVRTYTVGFADNQIFDESSEARQIADILDTEHHEVLITVQNFLEKLAIISVHQDEPISDPVCVPLYFVTKLARDTGTIVLQAGEGADEIFCGYENYIRFLRHHRNYWSPLALLPRLAGSLLFWGLRPFVGLTDHRVGKVADILRRRGLGQELFMSSAVAFYEWEKQKVLSSDFRQRMRGLDSFDVVRSLYARLYTSAPKATFLQRLTFIELNLRLPELLLMRVDKMSMANSVEVRVPFLDHRLVEFAMSVPDSFKLRDGIPKEPVKRYAAKSMPKELIYKPKKGFGVPIQEWINGPLNRHLREVLTDPTFRAERFFDVRHLLAMLDGGLKSVNQAFQLWVVYNFLIWWKNLASSTR